MWLMSKTLLSPPNANSIHTFCFSASISWMTQRVGSLPFCCCVQGSAVAVSAQGDGGRHYNDGKWHHIIATRRGAVGTIVVNNQYRGNAFILTAACIACLCGCVSVHASVHTCKSVNVSHVGCRSNCVCLLHCVETSQLLRY